MNPREIEARVRRMAWPTPSPELRARVLSTAVVDGPRITWSDRVWFSRGWRLSALAAALVIVAVDQMPGGPPSVGASPGPYAEAQAQAVEGAARQVGIPTELATSFGRRAFSEAPRPRIPALTGQAVQELELETPGGTE